MPIQNETSFKLKMYTPLNQQYGPNMSKQIEAEKTVYLTHSITISNNLKLVRTVSLI